MIGSTPATSLSTNPIAEAMKCRKLISLTVYDFWLTTPKFHRLKAFTNLIDLGIASMYGTNSMCKVIADSAPGLVSLLFYITHGIDIQGIRCFALGLRELVYLDVSGTDLGWRGLEVLAEQPDMFMSLKELWIAKRPPKKNFKRLQTALPGCRIRWFLDRMGLDIGPCSCWRVLCNGNQ